MGHSPTKVCSVCIQDTIGSEPIDLLFGQVFSDIEARHEGGVRGRGWYAPIWREPMVADRSPGIRWHGHELSFWSRWQAWLTGSHRPALKVLHAMRQYLKKRRDGLSFWTPGCMYRAGLRRMPW